MTKVFLYDIIPYKDLFVKSFLFGETLKTFTQDMTVQEAMANHPKAREVFAGFHLGGCSHCGISEYETVYEVCQGYGVPVDMLLNVLNSLNNEIIPENKEEEKQ